jgi:hypothetical protein
MVRLALVFPLALQQEIIKHTYLWIDALCIDQRNTRERNHQVHFDNVVVPHTEMLTQHKLRITTQSTCNNGRKMDHYCYVRTARVSQSLKVNRDMFPTCISL